MRFPNIIRTGVHPIAVAVGIANLAISGGFAHAQEVDRRASSALLEEVVVTARKREEGAQEVPLSVTAFNSDQINALKVRNLSGLKVGMPNVALEDVGTIKGTANFSVRGLGINSSIPSIDPTVGVFVNGVYLGINQGIIFDVFDLESIEVLRGPQGTLFGRNVTGGAILMNTKKPGEELDATLRYAVDTGKDGGYNSYYMGSVGGPVTDTLSARLALYYNDDDGQFENEFTGDDFGETEQKMARGTVVWTPTESTGITVVYEYTDIESQGPAAQSHERDDGSVGTPTTWDRDSFKFSIDEEGNLDSDTDFVTVQLDQGVSWGEGTITAIYGYRDFSAESVSDIDGQPIWGFHAPANTESTQNSFELRYNGLFFDQRANVTFGGMYYDNDLKYHERRDLLGVLLGGAGPFLRQEGGGEHDTETYSAFAQVDFDLSEAWTLTAGVNYSSEDKDVKIASLSSNVSQFPNLTSCNIVKGPSCPFDFVDDDSWDNWAPKLGVTYNLSDDSRIYAHWTRGYRSGGYNLRNTDPAVAPGPFNEEEVNNYEIGYKSSHSWGRVNAAVFYMEIDDQQREINLDDPNAGVVQIIRNTADTTISGFELDGTFSVTENLILLANVGYVDAEYDKVRFDLNGDGLVDGQDKGLDVPRSPEWSYSLGATYDMELGSWGYMTARANYSYRDEFEYLDSNLGFIDELEMLDAGLDFTSNDGKWIFSVYGRNLLDESNHGGDTQLPSFLGPVALGGTFSPLTPGIRYGVEVTYNFF